MWPPFSETPADGRTPPVVRPPRAEAVDDSQIIEAMEAAHVFPGYYPIVVIARDDDDFRERLNAVLGGWGSSDARPFRISERPSSQGAYISFRVEVFVDSPRTALDRKTVIAEIAGVLMML